jgi:hypothetical protein
MPKAPERLALPTGEREPHQGYRLMGLFSSMVASTG